MLKINNNRISYATVLLVVDIVAFTFAIMLAYVTRVMFDNFLFVKELVLPFTDFYFQSWWILLFYIVMNAAYGLYVDRSPFWLEGRQLSRSVNTVFIIAFAVVSLVKMSDFISRLLLLLLWAYMFVFSIMFRYIVKKVMGNAPFFMADTIVFGKYSEANELLKILDKEQYMGFNIVNVVSTTTDKSLLDKEELKLTYGNKVDEVINNSNISAAIFLPSFEKIKDNHLIASKLQIKLPQIYFVNPKQKLAFANVRTMQTFKTELSMFQVNNNISSRFNRFSKRLLDLVLCIAALPFLLLITGAIAIAIRATSTGKVFYTQERIGRWGKPFQIYKFRSMYEDADERLHEVLKDEKIKAEWDKTFKIKNDPRVTTVGKFIRKTSLDELPQLFNVIKGEMSIVGPRPKLPKEVDEFYTEYTDYYNMVRPGITGIWQISGRSNTTFEYRVMKDTWYVLNWSVWLDLVILLETPLVVLKREGAY